MTDGVMESSQMNLTARLTRFCTFAVKRERAAASPAVGSAVQVHAGFYTSLDEHI